MTFKMQDLQDIGLKQWFKDGDHPDVTMFNDTKYDKGNICPQCSKNYKDHGLVKNPASQPATDYDHFHGKNSTTVCPGDYVYKSTNENNVEQIVVIPEKVLRNIDDRIVKSYKETIVDTKTTNVITRIYNSRDFSLNSDVLKILNTEYKHHADNFDLDTEQYKHTSINFTGIVTENYNLTTNNYKHVSKDHIWETDTYSGINKVKYELRSNVYEFMSIDYSSTINLQWERTRDRYIRADKYLRIDSWEIHFIKRDKEGRELDKSFDENPVIEAEFKLWDWFNEVNAKLADHEARIIALENK